MLELDERTLADRLEETPERSGLLWKAYWGVKEGSNCPKVIDDISEAINRSGSCITTLVHGDYGTGKTSFMRLLRQRLEDKGYEKGCNPNSTKNKTNDGQQAAESSIRTLWLHMPGLTNRIDSSVVAVVVSAIVNELENLIKNKKQANLEFSDDLSWLKNQLADLWRIESRTQNPEQDTNCIEAPQPSRMVGSGCDISERYRAANTIEVCIDYVLEKLYPSELKNKEPEPEGQKGLKLVVFLDDLDRCPLSKGSDLIRLLLRFSGNSQYIHFVIASDRRVLEHGVEEWMQEYGMQQNGVPLVTANSALEKYIDFDVRLPRFDDKVDSDYVEDWLGRLLQQNILSDEFLKKYQFVKISEQGKPTLLDIYITWFICGLNH